MSAGSKRVWWPNGRTRAGCALLVLVLTAAACATAPSTPATPIPITDFRMVPGRWVGVVGGLAGSRSDEGDWVELKIGETGTYDFGIYRTIGALTGSGTLTLSDGKLTSEGERGRASYTLSERGGRQYLRTEGVTRSGTSVSGDLRRDR